MKNLKDLLKNISIISSSRSMDVPVDMIAFDSRLVKSDWVFVALKGTLVDGHDYISLAIENGATVIVCEIVPEIKHDQVNYIHIKDSHNALGIIASNYYDNPSQKMKLIGVTGTNGKTTVVTLLHQLFIDCGYSTGMLSTITNMINEEEFASTHTTPDPIQLNGLLNQMIISGVTHCFMEVSSHAIDQGRIAGLKFAGGLFTNLTHDHLDYHKTFINYRDVKKKFFDDLNSESFAITNVDDKNGMIMLQNCKAKSKTYSLKRMADYRARILENQFDGLVLDIDGVETWCRLVGEYNAYNLMVVYATAIELGIEKVEVLSVLSLLEGAEGRFDYLKSKDNIIAIVDYAHTPDAVGNVLDTIKAIRTGSENLITVIGAGGDRDKTKRPLMAKIATEKSDKVILTSDNPRTEDPEIILNEMKEGVEVHEKKKTLCITNREEAIKTACALASSGDIILVAGKGHEKYQEIDGVKYAFDDKEILMNNLEI